MQPKRAKHQRRDDRGALLTFAAGAACLLLMAAGLATLMTGARQRADGNIGGPFTLVSDVGQIVTDHSFPGKYKLIYFGYTHCPDVCPATLTTLAAALERIGTKSSRVQALFITLDPANDTPAVLHRYVRAFGQEIVGLTGEPAALRQVAAAYHVMQENADGGLLDHSSVIYLMAPDGNFLAPIEAQASEMVMAKALDRRIAS